MAVAVAQVGAQVWSQSTTNNGLTLTPTLSTTPSSSNLVVLFVHNDAGGLTNVSIPTPSGWTAGPTYSATASTTNDLITSIFYITGFSGTSVTVTLDATTGGSSYYGTAALMELSGVNTSMPTAMYATAQASTPDYSAHTLTGASATPTLSGLFALSLWGWNDNSDDTATAQPSGWTTDIELTNGAVNPSVYASLDVQHQTATTTNGTAINVSLGIDGASYVSPAFCNILWIINPTGIGAGWVQSVSDQMKLFGMIH